MNTLSVRVRYRPIRIGWCVRTGDLEALQKALKLTFTMWGGRYNPVIPVDDFDLACALVRLFRVDVLWPASEDNHVKEFIGRFTHLPNPFFHKQLFVPAGDDERSAQLVDIYHPILQLYEEHFKNNPSPEVNVTIYEWQPDDPLANVLLATFGALPSVEITGNDYLELLKQYLSAKTVAVNPSAPLHKSIGKEWTVSTFCRAYMTRHYSVQNYRGQPGFYVGSGNDFKDLVTFWNLRATDTPLVFYDPNHAARLDPQRTVWLELLRSEPKGRFESDNFITVWFKEGGPRPNVSIFGEGVVLSAARDVVWNGLNVKAPYMYFSQGSSLGAIGENTTGRQEVSFQLPQKPFSDDGRLYHQNLVVAIDAGIGLYGNERATLRTLYVPELNEYYGRQCYFEWDKARAEPESLGIITHASRSDLSLRALDVVELIARLFGVVGISAEPSKPGLIAARLIQQMGGLRGCRPFKIPGVRNLVEKYNPQQPFTRSAAIQAIRGLDPETGIASFTSYEDLYIEARPPGSKLTPDAVLGYLLKKGVFRAGLRFDCPNCRLEFWSSLDDVRTEATCEYCGHKFNVTPHLKDRDWAFRRSGLFGRDDNQEGAIPVVLTLQQLQTTFISQEMLYTTAMTLKPESANIQECETDFVVVVQRLIDQKTDIAIGECKTRKQITDDDVTKLKAVAEVFPSDRFNVFVIFSKLDSFTPDELTRTRRVNDQYHRRAILFTPRELEPQRLYDRTAEQFKVAPYAVTFEEMANVTEQVFFGGEG